MNNIIAIIIAIIEAALLYKLINDESAAYKLRYRMLTASIILAMVAFVVFAA